jgi:hypothetical protein
MIDLDELLAAMEHLNITTSVHGPDFEERWPEQAAS